MRMEAMRATSIRTSTKPQRVRRARHAKQERNHMISRKEYMADSPRLHHAYYLQFATDRTRRLVEQTIGKERILASVDPHFNDIPLREWDMMEQRVKDTINRTLLGASE